MVVFLLMHLLPGDPARLIAGLNAPEEEVIRLRSQLGLDQPLPVQYARFLGQLLRGDLGTSIRSSAPVLKEIAGVQDMAYDTSRDRLYLARGEEGLFYLELASGQLWGQPTPPDQFGNRRVTGVAVDPSDPDLIYMAQHKNVYTASVSVARSADAGRTWTVLNRTEPLDGKHRDGAREAMTVRVHPRTREAWVSTNCMGIWKIAAPTEKAAGQDFGAPARAD
jgi:hypothetical protein